MSIASRINEMAEHLRNDWDSIDKLGLDITEENSNDNLDKNIKNIAPVLDRFYNHVSDKTDLSENGIVGRTSQDGNPTPENPVEINNLSGDVEYKVRGKNLFDKDNLIANYRLGSDGAPFYQDGYSLTEYISVEPNTTYCRNIAFVTVKPVCLYDSSKTFISRITTGSSFTTTSETKYIRTAVSTDNINITQLEKGTTASTYEPYISESFPLSLGDIKLCNISNYKDRIYSQNGEFYLEKNTDKVVLDGSESITTTTYSAGAYFHNIINIGMNGTNNNYAMSNYYTYSSSYMNNTCKTANGGKELVTRDNFDQSTYITWLGTNKPIFYYILATPTTTEITQENYPTLYSQLLAIQEFLTKYKINKEFLLDYSSLEIEY